MARILAIKKRVSEFPKNCCCVVSHRRAKRLRCTSQSHSSRPRLSKKTAENDCVKPTTSTRIAPRPLSGYIIASIHSLPEHLLPLPPPPPPPHPTPRQALVLVNTPAQPPGSPGVPWCLRGGRPTQQAKQSKQGRKREGNKYPSDSVPMLPRHGQAPSRTLAC